VGAVVLVTALGVGGVIWQWREALSSERVARAAEHDAEVATEVAQTKAKAEEEAKIEAQKATNREALARDEEKQAKENALAAFLRADGLRLGAESTLARRTDPGLALLLGLEAVQQAPNHLTYQALYAASSECQEVRTLYGHQGAVRSA